MTLAYLFQLRVAYAYGLCLILFLANEAKDRQRNICSDPGRYNVAELPPLDFIFIENHLANN